MSCGWEVANWNEEELSSNSEGETFGCIRCCFPIAQTARRFTPATTAADLLNELQLKIVFLQGGFSFTQCQYAEPLLLGALCLSCSTYHVQPLNRVHCPHTVADNLRAKQQEDAQPIPSANNTDMFDGPGIAHSGRRRYARSGHSRCAHNGHTLTEGIAGMPRMTWVAN